MTQAVPAFPHAAQVLQEKYEALITLLVQRRDIDMRIILTHQDIDKVVVSGHQTTLVDEPIREPSTPPTPKAVNPEPTTPNPIPPTPVGVANPEGLQTQPPSEKQFTMEDIDRIFHGATKEHQQAIVAIVMKHVPVKANATQDDINACGRELEQYLGG